MLRLDLDYLRTPAGPKWIPWALLGVGALALVAVDRAADEADARIEALGSALSAATRAQAKSVASPATGATMRNEIRAAYAVAQRLSTPWHTLFDAVEAAQTPGIRLTAIQPDAIARSASVSGEARDYLVLLNYLSSLETRGGLKRVHLSAHEQKSAASPIAFTVQGRWDRPQTTLTPMTQERKP
jgi:Tfp pilus assembly protein PilN